MGLLDYQLKNSAWAPVNSASILLCVFQGQSLLFVLILKGGAEIAFEVLVVRGGNW